VDAADVVGRLRVPPKCRTATVAGAEQRALTVSDRRPAGTRHLPAIGDAIGPWFGRWFCDTLDGSAAADP
jgi:hypothetical protein